MSTVSYPPMGTGMADGGTLLPGLASAFRGSLNAYVQGVEDKAQAVAGQLEQVTRYLGGGAVTGGTVAAGSGLNVTITGYTAICGSVVAQDGPSTVLCSASTTNYLWLREDNSFSVNATGVVPGTADGKGTAVYWGTVLTGASSVTSVENHRPYAYEQKWTAGTVANGGTILGERVLTLNFGAATAGTVYLPRAARTPMPVTIINLNTGTISVFPMTGDTLNGGTTALTLTSQYSGVQFYSTGGTAWVRPWT